LFLIFRKTVFLIVDSFAPGVACTLPLNCVRRGEKTAQIAQRAVVKILNVFCCTFALTIMAQAAKCVATNNLKTAASAASAKALQTP
jgi:hypothetical protein